MKRYDWWRWWICTRPAPGYACGSLSVVLTVAGREWAIGFRYSQPDVEPTHGAPGMTPRWTPHADLGTNERSGT